MIDRSKRDVTASVSVPALARFFVRQYRTACSCAVAILLLSLVPGQATAAIAFVQVNSAVPQSPQSSVSVTFTAAQTAGNLNIIAVGWNDSTAVVNSVTDSSGNVYTRAVGPTAVAGALSQSIYYARNIVAAGANANSVTVLFNIAAIYVDVRILEYGGIDTVNPVDVTAARTGSNATSSTTAVATTNANDLLFAANTVATFTSAPGASFTSRVVTTPNGDIAEDRIVTVTGSYSASARLNGAGAWVMQMVAFKAAGGATDTTPPTAPTGLTATANGSSGINLSWTASTDNVAVTGYRVERCQSAGCSNFAQVGTPAGTTFGDTGLLAGTSYSYRVRATDAATNLSAYSSVSSATTTDTTAPSSPSGLTATASGSSGINLSWTASTDNVAVTGYRVERCQGAGCSNFAQVATPNGTTFGDTGLLAGTSYRYRVRASDAAGNLSGYSGIATATTSTVPDTTPPTAPSALVATSNGSSGINLSWTASTDNVAVTGYRVERCQGAGCSNFAQVGTPSGTTFGDSGLLAGTSYSYRVRASDAAANLSAYSNISSATTNAVSDTTPPTAPSGLIANASGSSGINLSWTASTDNVAVTGYRVERCQGAGCSNFAQVGTPSGTTFGDSGLLAGTSYSYRVRASDAAANLSAYSNISSATTNAVSDTTPPTAPSGLIANASGSSGINLSWTASTDNVAVTGYRVERCQGAGCSNFTQVGTPSGTTFGDSGLLAGTSYSYRVRASDAAANLSAYSNTATATTTAARTIAFVQSNSAVPQSPQSSVAVTYTVAQTAGNLNVIAVGWNDSTAVVNSVTDSSGNIYTRAVGPTAVAGALSQSIYYARNIAAAGANANSVTVLFNIPAQYADVRILEYSGIDTANPVDVTAAGTGSNATSSTTAVTTTNANDLLFAANMVATFTSAPGAGFTSRVVTTPNGDIAEDRIVTVTGSYSASATLNAAGAWVMQMVAFKAAGGATDTTPPTAPSGLTATANGSSGINLSWTASTDNVAVTGYRVERCQGAGCSNFAQVGTPSATTFGDSGLLAGTSYSYRVRATDAAANLSAYSNVSSATTSAVDTTPPTAPSALFATASSSSGINLSWTASTDNVAVTGYRVERCQGAGCSNFAQVGTPSATTFGDSGLLAGTSYSYRVRATDAATNLSGYSNTASATTPSSAGVFQNEILITGFDLPTAVKFLPDGRMLVLELGGTIWKVDPSTWDVDPTPFLVLTNVGTLNGQQGLLDFVLDPNFATNRYYYVFYTLGIPNQDRVSRFTANASLSGTVSGSEFVLYQDPFDAHAEHHGGALNFGSDGKLYITTGEHFDPPLAQLLTSSRGKILRLNTDGSVPTDNPFYDGAGPNVDAIWARGLRNPFRASFDAVTGRLYIGDVGGNIYATAREEVNVGVRGANYGWPNCEGFSCGGNPAYTSPLYDYGHNSASGGLRDAAVTGGFVYRGSQFPSQYYGSYFFADYAQNWIKRLTLDPIDGHVTGLFNFEPPDGAPDGPAGDIVHLSEGPDGALYYVDLGYSDTTGQVGVSKIRRIRFISSNLPPIVVASAAPTVGLAPLAVSFSSVGTSDPEGNALSYSWNFGDGGISTLPNPVHTYVTNGPFTARLTVSDGNSNTLSSPITIRVGNPPVVTSMTPPDGLTFRAGDTVSFSGDATDVEDGILPASAFSWSIDFLHEGHVHPATPQTGTKSGTFVIPTSGHDFHGNTRYRITLTVTDSSGLQSSQVAFIYPQKVNITLDSVPSGLTLTLDGLPMTTPAVYDTLVGFNHEVEAPDQAVLQTLFTFTSWSDGGAKKHIITVPAAASSLLATYAVSQNPFPNGLVAGYRFSEGAGITAADLSGNGNNGTLVLNPTWTTGQYGGGLAFDGANYVNLGTTPSLQLTGSMTLSAWIRIGANPFDDAAIVAKLGSAGWQLKTSPDTGPRTAAIQISSNGSDSIQRYSATTLSVGVWYHVAGVYDAAARTLDIYVNGVLDNGVLAGTVPAAQYNAPFEVNIGQRTGVPQTFNFLGTLDEVHVFNRALSGTEVQTDMIVPR